VSLINETHNPALRSWIESANASQTEFPIQNLPFGVFRRRSSLEARRCFGADLANLINEAAIAATRRNAEDVAFNDFTTAMERVVAGNLGTMEASCVM
jgi:fumarylacetoacetase